jgi:hypothetical protein
MTFVSLFHRHNTSIRVPKYTMEMIRLSNEASKWPICNLTELMFAIIIRLGVASTHYDFTYNDNTSSPAIQLAFFY